MSLEAELQQARSLIRQLQGALGGKSIRSGTGSVVFTASATSANATVAHGLGAVPVVTFGAYHDVVYEIVSKDATNFVVKGWAPGGAITATLGFDWHATA